MDPIRFQQIATLFEAARVRPPPEREALLTARCGSDADLREQVLDLLREHDRFDAASSTCGGLAARVLRLDSIGVRAERPKHIGPFKILGQLGEGGMGAVYLAEQQEPLRRRVALKLIRYAHQGEVLARFEQERQVLALMSHPNVAAVYDAGATLEGEPYFVMEYVPGRDISHHCDERRSTIRERIELLIQVCDAVQHAHQKGIIHRDLKPSNILVGLVDDRPLPKVIDFGVAKATAAPLAGRTLHTEVGRMIGTPEYMSPEQTGSGGLDVDTRSDVYSLGVILYQLLTGLLPFDSATLRSADYEGLMRMIREAEPPRPSVRLSRFRNEPVAEHGGATPAEIAARRRTDLAALERQVRGELDWIVMKCLEKDRERRYATANALALELRRYLDREPVLAGPPSRAYRLRKLIQRHRGSVVAAVMVSGALLIGFGVAVWQAVRAQREANRAETQWQLAEERREESARLAEFQAAQLSSIDVESMGLRMREDLLEHSRQAALAAGRSDAAADAQAAELEQRLTGLNFTDFALHTLERSILERATRAIDEQFARQPLMRAALLHTLAETMRSLGLLERALAPQSEALAIRRRILGDEHPDTLASVSNMGLLLEELDRIDEAAPYFQEALDGRRRVLGPDHAETAAALSNLGSLLQHAGRYEEALACCREAVEANRRALGDEHSQTLTAINNLGYVLQSMGRYDEALVFFREALETRRRVLGDDDPRTLNSLNNMGFLHKSMGQLEAAREFYDEALSGRRRVLGDGHPRTLESFSGMGNLLQSMGRYDEAAQHFTAALDVQRRILGNEHRETLITINNLGHLFHSLGRLEEAQPYYEEALGTFRRTLGPEHSSTVTLIGNMGSLLRMMGRLEEAAAYQKEHLELARRVHGDEHPKTISAILKMGLLCKEQGRFDDAMSLHTQALEISRRTLPEEHVIAIAAVTYMGGLLDEMGRTEEALLHCDEALKIRRRVYGDAHHHTLLSVNQKGKLLHRLGRLAEAERYLLEAAGGAIHLPSTLGVNTTVAENLVELYRTWDEAEPGQGHDVAAAEWQAKLHSWQAATQPSP